LPITVNVARKPVPVVDTEGAPPNIRMRDRRKDPVGLASKTLMASPTPTKNEIKAAHEEFVQPLNRLSYYTDYSSWWGICQRHCAVQKAGETGDGKLAKALIRQLWQEYVRLMKDGSFERRWGSEPVTG
jgi:hypothetical protein